MNLVYLLNLGLADSRCYNSRLIKDYRGVSVKGCTLVFYTFFEIQMKDFGNTKRISTVYCSRHKIPYFWGWQHRHHLIIFGAYIKEQGKVMENELRKK